MQKKDRDLWFNINMAEKRVFGWMSKPKYMQLVRSNTCSVSWSNNLTIQLLF